MLRCLTVLRYAVCALACNEAAGADLYRCSENGVVTYAHGPCASGEASVVTIDRAVPDDEARIAREVEIAAIREGADIRVSAADRAALQALRSQLASPDREVRAKALVQWRALYARYRTPARPRVQPTPPGLGSASPRLPPEPPLGGVVPGSQGPLTAQPPVLALPSRPSPVADPQTGRVLAPAGSDRMIDPMTGTLWMRSGRVYVDPLSGRVIPAP